MEMQQSEKAALQRDHWSRDVSWLSRTCEDIGKEVHCGHRTWHVQSLQGGNKFHVFKG